MFATPTSTCDDDRLSGSLSSSSHASKAAGDLKASETPSLNSNLCGLIPLMAPSGYSSSSDSWDNETLSSRKNFQRTLQKITVSAVASTLAALPWI